MAEAKGSADEGGDSKVKAKKEPKPDAIVKLDAYLSNEWNAWLKTQQDQAALRRRGLANRATLYGTAAAPHQTSVWGNDRSTYKRRIDNDVSFADWLE